MRHGTFANKTALLAAITLGIAGSVCPSVSKAQKPAMPGVKVLQILPNDDSVTLTLAPVAGAADYRVYNIHHPDDVKYSGGSTTIEWNGVSPSNGADIAVEAVDALGPYSSPLSMDVTPVPAPPPVAETGPVCPCCGHHGCVCNGKPGCVCSMGMNGHGVSTNVPNVIARTLLHVTPHPRTLTGGQPFFETWRSGNNPFVSTSEDPAVAANNIPAARFENSRWTLDFLRHDENVTYAFLDHGHFMDVLGDSQQVAYGMMTLTPKHTWSLAKGSVGPGAHGTPGRNSSQNPTLHATFEVDGVFDDRRWVQLWVYADGDTLVIPDTFHETVIPTLSGRAVAVRWDGNSAMAFGFGLTPSNAGSTSRWVYPWQNDSFHEQQEAMRSGMWALNQFNGDSSQLDQRHRFDVYLSATHLKVTETCPPSLANPTPAAIVQIDKDLPAPMPFSKLRVAFQHVVYHTALEEIELSQNLPWGNYWLNNTPNADERHWDNMGAEVLPAMP